MVAGVAEGSRRAWGPYLRAQLVEFRVAAAAYTQMFFGESSLDAAKKVS